jgi:hypothetical protein
MNAKAEVNAYKLVHGNTEHLFGDNDGSMGGISDDQGGALGGQRVLYY